MSSLPFLTSELQALSKEAGRKHGDVKEAADKALALLKSSPESALSDLHEDHGKHPVLLAPIVLGCSTKNPKVTSIAVSGLQRLAGIRGAITKHTVPTILTTLRSVMSQGVEIQLKILQTLVSLLTNCKDIHDDLLAETLLISFKLLESKIGVVSSTAAATLRQLVMFVFENVDAEDKVAIAAKDDPSVTGPIPTSYSVAVPASSPQSTSGSTERTYLLPAARDAYLVFEDICLLVNGDQPSFLKLQALPRTFGLELIESVLSDFSSVFISHSELLHLLRTLLSPLLIRALAEKPAFSTTLRLMRVMYLLLKKFNDHLIMESEIFLCMFVKIVAPGETEGSGGHPLSSSMLPAMAKEGKLGGSQSSGGGYSPPWMRVLALEILRGLCGDFALLSKIWSRYDAPHELESAKTSAEGSLSVTSQHLSSKVPVFTSMITALNKLATERPALLGQGTAVVSGVIADPQTGEYTVSGVVDGIVGMAHQAASSVGVSGLAQGGLALATATVKLQCIDQLDKADPPSIPETYVFLLSLQCLNAIGEGFAGHTLPIYSALMARRPKNGNEPLPAPPAVKFDEQHLPDETYTSLKGARDMADAAWPALLASLAFYLTTNLDDDLFAYTLSAFQQFNTTCGVLDLKTPRDAFLISLCKFAVPPPIISNLASADSNSPTPARPQLNSVLSAGADVLGLSVQQTQPMSLSTRNLLCLRSLIHVAQALAGSLEKTWFYVFEALQNADLVVKAEASRRQKKRTHPSSLASASTSSRNSGNTVTQGSTGSIATSTSPSARYVPSDEEEQAAQARATRLFEASKALDDDAFRWFVEALCYLNAQMIGIPVSELGQLIALPSNTNAHVQADLEHNGEHVSYVKQPKRTGINVMRTLRPGEKSYAVTKLGDISVMNMRRIVSRPSELGWSVIIKHLLLVQHWQNAPAHVRLQAAEVFDKILTTAPKDTSDVAEELQKRTQEHVFSALMQQAEPQDRSSFSTDVEIRQAALDTLYRLLESHGHALLCGWKTIFCILQTACPAAKIPIHAGAAETSAATATKMSQLVRVAFPSLQLICSDFLAALSLEESGMCVTTLAAFGRQVEDVNVALTAGNLLWQVSDHLQAIRRQSEEAEAYLKLWMDLLLSLLELCKDDRSEARDGAIQILWRSIELYGATLDIDAWEQCLSGVIFPLLTSLDAGLTKVERETFPEDVERTALGFPLPYKQWDDSKILAVTSAATVFSNELPSNILKLPSFERVCKDYIAYMTKSFLQDRPSVATAAAKALEKVCQVRWDESSRNQGSFLATTVWEASLELGQAIKQPRQHGLTQQNIECFLKIIAAIQEGAYLDFGDDHVIQLLDILKTSLTYAYSPDYRPDQDVMPPVQSMSINIIDHINLASSAIASAVLQDLAEYMVLAYTSLSEAVRSPALPGTRPVNHKVTYIALSKNATGRILDIYQRFKDDPLIYQSAVGRILSSYAVPLRLKYECPLPSKFGDDPPLWKTATSHFLELARSIVQSLGPLAAQLTDEVTADIWRQIVACFRAILQADCRPVMDMSLEDQRGEEDFDLAVIVTLEANILPCLGQQRVPTDAIISLVQALRDASMLHTHDPQYESGSQLISPNTTIVHGEYSPDVGSVRHDQKQIEDSSDWTSNDTLDGSTMDDYDLPRERFAYWCLDILFLMCNRAPSGSSEENKRLAVLALPTLFSRCSSVLRLYLADSAVRGKVPFRRVREEELVHILSRLSKLQLDEGVFEAAFTKDDDPVKVLKKIENGDEGLQQHLSYTQLLASAARRSSKAHLYGLYPHLLALLALPRLANTVAAQAAPYASLDFSSPLIASSGDTRQTEFHGVTSTVANTLKRTELTGSNERSMTAKDFARLCLELAGQGFEETYGQD